MSVALAIVSQNGTVVASEGRAIQNCSLVSDCFDKTFPLLDGGILGAHTGLLRFGGMKVGEHINDILKAKYAEIISLDKLAALLIYPFIKRVEKVNFTEQKVDILLADRQVIYGMRIQPSVDNSRISFSVCNFDGLSTYAYCACGDDLAMKATLATMNACRDQISSMHLEDLINLAQRAIQKGIDNAGPSKQNGNLCSCGGEIYHRYI